MRTRCARARAQLKKLHIVFSESDVPEDIQGIAFQRGGMKIWTYIPEFLSPELKESIYGYITLEEESEKKLLEYESPEHYSFNFKRAFPKAIKSFVESEINAFAREKLGWKSDYREYRRQLHRNAERRALSAINKIARKFGFSGIGISRRKSGGGGGGKAKAIRIIMPDLILPRLGDLRVNYGETVENITCAILNKEKYEIKVMLKIFLRHHDLLINTYFEDEITIAPNSTSKHIGPFVEEFTKDRQFEPGEYTVVARIVSLMEHNRGEKLDEKKKKFYLEQEPPRGGIFERCDGLEYPDDVIDYMGEAVDGESGGYILQYNIKHSEFERIQYAENLIASYLYRILVHELCRIDLLEETPKLFTQSDLEAPDALLSKTLKFMGEFSSEYYSHGS